MQLGDYKQLDALSQLQTLWDVGKPLIKEEDDQYVYNLYQLDNFYVEAIFNIHTNYMSALNYFEVDDKLLDEYIEQIPLPKLL
ncbi:MAG: hypothetical protein V4556_10085 [Bacteroidota bacterium]